MSLVIGVGNPDRGDDGVGPAVLQTIRGRSCPEGVRLVDQADPVRLVDVWEGEDTVVVVDAVHSGQPAGTVLVLDAGQGPLPATVGSVSSHAFGLAAAVELARALDRLPARLTVVGVEAGTGRGAGLSAPVTAALDRAAATVLATALGSR